MSTTKPRITVTLEPRHHEVLSRLSAASGESMSQIVAGFVDLAIPSLERVVVVLERAKAAPQEVRAGLAAAIQRADEQLLPVLQSAVNQADMFLADAAVVAATPTDAGASRRERSGGGGRAKKGLSTPVPVTRGSGQTKVGEKASRKGVTRG